MITPAVCSSTAEVRPELLADCSGYSVGREQDDGELALAPRPSLAHLDVLTELVREAGSPRPGACPG